MEKLTFFSHHLPMDGYGYAGIKIGAALRELDGGVELVNMLDEEGKHTDFGKRKWKAEGRAVALCLPDWYPDIETAGGLVGFTMFESTRMPWGRVLILNKLCSAVLVPCEWCKDVFEAQGVRAPVRVARWGIDAEDYPVIDRSGHDGPYTFLWSGTPDQRKGWDVAYRAFVAAFGDRKDVRLVLHFRKKPVGVMGCADENVEMVEGKLRLEEWRLLLGKADCFVFPSRGEGWGLPPREAAATGLPAIATDWGGLHEEIEHWGIPLRVKGVKPACFGEWDAGEIGVWAEPDLDDLVDKMRSCVEHPVGVEGIGRMAANWTREYASWERTAAEIASAGTPRNDRMVG